MKINDLLDSTALAAEIEAGMVKRREHPTEPLAILNYSDKAQYAGGTAWTPTVQQCRGLIYRTDTGEIVARPWRKFWNHGQAEAGDLDLGAPVEVTDKMDGSLGIRYPLPSGGYAIATRGAFASDQALWATALWRERYAHLDDGALNPYRTHLFEIVYPSNRIVLDYGDMEDLVLLGAVDVETGRPYGPRRVTGWTGPATEVFDYPTLADALAAPPRQNAEGLVVRRTDTGHIVKVKQSDYVALHRLVTGLNARVVWEYLTVGACKDTITEPKHWGTYLGLDPARAAEVIAMDEDWEAALLSKVPDEFYGWVQGIITDLHREAGRIDREVRALVASVPTDASPREQFQAVADSPHQRIAVALVRGQGDAEDRLTQWVWKNTYPEVFAPFVAQSEATA